MMDKNELCRMFDRLSPSREQEESSLARLLPQTERRKTNMAHWRKRVAAAVVAALLVTTAAAAALPGVHQRLLEYLGIAPDDTQTVELLAPGAMAVDVSAESGGAILHASQVLRDRSVILVLAELTAPEGTILNMGDQDAPGLWMKKGFSITSEDPVYFLDQDSAVIPEDLVDFYEWEILEDDDPLDNRLTMMFTLYPKTSGQSLQNAAFLQFSASDLSYFDGPGFDSEAIYTGSWVLRVPLPQQDMGWSQTLETVIGELDGAAVTIGELYLSPMTLEFSLTLAPPPNVDPSAGDIHSRWLSLASDPDRVTLSTADGETIPLTLSGSRWISGEEQLAAFCLGKITDPARFQGGTLTLRWSTGEITIPLEGAQS